MRTLAALIREPDGLRYYLAAAGYVLVAYVLGFAGLFYDRWLVSLPATLLLAHAMTIAAYLIHECGHNLVFVNARHNDWLG